MQLSDSQTIFKPVSMGDMTRYHTLKASSYSFHNQNVLIIPTVVNRIHLLVEHIIVMVAYILII